MAATLITPTHWLDSLSVGAGLVVSLRAGCMRGWGEVGGSGMGVYKVQLERCGQPEAAGRSWVTLSQDGCCRLQQVGLLSVVVGLLCHAEVEHSDGVAGKMGEGLTGCCRCYNKQNNVRAGASTPCLEIQSQQAHHAMWTSWTTCTWQTDDQRARVPEAHTGLPYL